MAQADIQDQDHAALAAWCTSVGEAPYRAGQILQWVHRRGAATWDDMSNLPRPLRARLAEAFTLERLAPATVAHAGDGTRKVLFDLPPGADGRAAVVESVLIPDVDRANGAPDRLTLCISSQAGCGMGCGFCATAQLGLIRNLRAAEIVGQVQVGIALGSPQPLTNLVLMGMGEPLANYDAVVRALEILTADWGYGISPRRITVSTVGLAPLVPQFIADTRVNLAVSLHAPTDRQRERLVPVNRRYPLAELMAACRAVPLPRRKRITFEYVLIAGENDADTDARALVGLLHGLRAKVNLIHWNPYPGATFAPTSAERVLRFQHVLREHGVSTSVRVSRGRDIQAACGQLAATRSAA